MVLKKIFAVILTLLSIILLVGCSTNNIEKKPSVQSTPTPIANTSKTTQSTSPQSTDPKSTAGPAVTPDTQAVEDQLNDLGDLLGQMDDITEQDVIIPQP